MRAFDPKDLKKLKRTRRGKSGQVTIVGGSGLFHGAPILALKVASRIVDMVFFSSPEPSVGKVAEQLKSQLSSFIWVPWEEVDAYIKKSDAVLIGPGFMRFRSEKAPKADRQKGFDKVAGKSRTITKRLLTSFPNQRWVIDAGSLQVMDASWIPKNAVLTPNSEEFETLFNVKISKKGKKKELLETVRRDLVSIKAAEYKCTIVLKGAVDIVCSPERCLEVKNGNLGLTKGGTGDVLAGLVVALLAQTEPLLAATSASWVTKRAADSLSERVGTVYNADDLADETARVLGEFLKA